MLIHSKFLIHWTGKDFHKPPGSPLTQDLREQYVQRLRDDCDRGLFMKKGAETIHGKRETHITAEIPRICFSEVRLSQAEKHATSYGMLGIGVHRDFVLERGGNPVFYVQNSDKDSITQNMKVVLQFLKNKVEKNKKAMFQCLGWVVTFMKGMSDENDSELQAYDEMEWRIVHTYNLMGKYLVEDEEKERCYRVLVRPEDIKILVSPDHKTKEMSIEDNKIQKFFRDGFPMMTTVEDCKSF